MRLLNYSSYDEILSLFMQTFKIVEFLWEPFQDKRLMGCHRASFLVYVSDQSYDAFYNSPAGYRGQYAKSTMDGDHANRKLLQRILPDLQAEAELQNVVPVNMVIKSLNATDAKVWIFECEVESHLGGETPEIIYAPWQAEACCGVGLRAPVGRKLEVKGGWLDRKSNECRDPFKAGRSLDIHTCGFS